MAPPTGGPHQLPKCPPRRGTNHKAQTERLYHHDALRIPDQYDFRGLGGLSSEMIERLERAQPGTFGDARRIAGMTSAGLTALLVNLTVAKQCLSLKFHVKHRAQVVGVSRETMSRPIHALVS